MEQKNQNQQAKRPLTTSEKVVLAVGTAALSNAALAADLDVSAGTAVIGGVVAVIGVIGAAKIVPQATMVVWGYVKQAFNRT